MTKTKRQPRTQKTASANSSPIEALLQLVSCSQLHRGAGGRPFARVPVADRFEFYELKSAAFRNWLVDTYLFTYQQAPSSAVLSRVVAVLEARAQFEGSLPTVHVRVAGDADAERHVSYLDLCDMEGRAVEIRPVGWSVVERPRVNFRRVPGMLPIPLPESGGTINLLRPYVNLGELDFRLFVAWITAAIRPSGPYPPLVICGEQGSAKTTLARVARLLIDPHSTPLLSEPTGTRDLMITALNTWVLAFDNVGELPGWLSDCFCRLAVGGGYATRTLYTDNQITYLHAQRPLILNGIENFVSRGDLIDRSVFLNLSPVHPSDRRTESELWSSFQFDYPRIMGSILDTIAAAMRVLPSLELDEVPRMADFAYWGEAVGKALGWPEQSFRSAYARSRRAATDNAIDDSAVADVLFDSVPSSLKWSGPIAALHRQLTEIAGKQIACSNRWPKNVTRFSSELRRLSPQLRERGLSISFSRSRDQRLITLTFDNNWLFRRPHGSVRLT
jgi:hypothetical protein